MQMKRFILIIAFILTIGIVIFSCKKDSTLAISGPNSISLSQYSTLETEKSSANWLSFSPSKGNSREGGAELTINCEANPEYEPRTAIIIYEDDKDWVSSTVVKTSKSETITLNIAANNTGVPRMGTIFSREKPEVSPLPSSKATDI